jgi:hypothetical protein
VIWLVPASKRLLVPVDRSVTYTLLYIALFWNQLSIHDDTRRTHTIMPFENIMMKVRRVLLCNKEDKQKPCLDIVSTLLNSTQCTSLHSATI